MTENQKKHSQPGRSLKENIFSLTVLQGANCLFPLILVPYLVRVLGPEKFGLLAFAQAFVQYFFMVTDYGFNLSATRLVSLNRSDGDVVSRIFCATLGAKFFLAILSFAIFLPLAFLVPRFADHGWLYLACFMAMPGHILFPVWYFQGRERMRMVTLINVMAKILVLLGIFLFVRNEDDYLLTAWIQSGGVMIGGLMAFGLVLTSGGISPRIPSSTEIFQSLRDGWHVFISTAGKSLYTNSNVFFLGLLTDPASVGFFSAAEKLVKAVQGLSYPVTQAVFPRINSLLKDSRELAVAFIRKTLKWLGLWTFLMSLFLFLAADPLVHMLFGNRFGVSVELVRWMSFLPLIIALSNVFGVQTMIPFGMKKEFSRILLFSGVFNLGLLIPLVSLFGASGAAVSVVLTELAITFSMYLSLRACGIRFFSCRQFALKLTAD